MLGSLSMEVTAWNIFSSGRLCLEVSGSVRTSSLSELLLVPKALTNVCLWCALAPLAAARAPTAWSCITFSLSSRDRVRCRRSDCCCSCPSAALQLPSFSPARGTRDLCVPQSRGGREQCLLASWLPISADLTLPVSSSRTGWPSGGSTSQILPYVALFLISYTFTIQGNEAADLRGIAKYLLFGPAEPNPGYAVDCQLSRTLI